MRTTKRDVLGRLEIMNRYTKSRIGEEYDTDFVSHYGGWNLWLKDSNGTMRGKLGFDFRKNTAEFMAYISGVINACAALPTTNK